MADYKVVPVEPSIEMTAALAFNGDVDLAIGHAAICKEVEESYRAMLDASPDTGMVAVPRELLERVYHGWNSSSDVLGPMQELRNFLEKAND